MRNVDKFVCLEKTLLNLSKYLLGIENAKKLKFSRGTVRLIILGTDL